MFYRIIMVEPINHLYLNWGWWTVEWVFWDPCIYSMVQTYNTNEESWIWELITEVLIFRCLHTLKHICALKHASALLNAPACIPLWCVWASVQAVLQYDTELTGVQEGGHRAQLNLWTKRCSLLMTQWDLPVRAWSMPAAVTADAQLAGTTLWPQKHKGNPASTFSQLGLFTSKASLFIAAPDAFSG